MTMREPKGQLELAFNQSESLDQQLGLKGANTVTEVKLKQNGETAVVRVVDGRVEVERGGVVTPFRPQYTIDKIVEEFKNNGWMEVVPEANVFTAPKLYAAPTEADFVPTPSPVLPESSAFQGLQHGVMHDFTITAVQGGIDPKVAQSAAVQNITIATQQEVDEYLELHKQMSELKKKQDKLKSSVRSYMDTNNLKSITGTFGQQVYLQDAKASNSTSLYSDYEMEDVMKALDGSLLKQVTEIRINSSKLEGLLKVEKLPKEKVKEIQALKICNPGTPRFAVKK